MNLKYSLDLISDLDIGYYFHKDDNNNSIGASALGINIYAQPTLHHFDPDHVDAYIVNSENQLEFITIFHPWIRKKEFTLAAGLITISDRLGKKVEAFSFGGTVMVNTFLEKTSSLFVSPAPILQLRSDQSLTMSEMLAEEVIKLLAIYKAEYYPKNRDFELRLSSLPPLPLYIASLHSIIKQYSKILDDQSPKIFEFKRFLRHSYSEIKEKNPIQYQGTTLEDLLLKGHSPNEV